MVVSAANKYGRVEHISETFSFICNSNTMNLIKAILKRAATRDNTWQQPETRFN